MGPAIAGVVQSYGAFQNLQFMRLATVEEITTFRQNAAKIAGAYKPPGQAREQCISPFINNGRNIDERMATCG
jgi:hypothetical protein